VPTGSRLAVALSGVPYLDNTIVLCQLPNIERSFGIILEYLWNNFGIKLFFFYEIRDQGIVPGMFPTGHTLLP